MNKLIISVSLALVLLAACNNEPKKQAQGPLTEAEQSAYLAQGKEIAQATFLALSGKLQSALVEGGPAQAISYCNVAAYPITDSLAKQYHAHVRRTALKYRNPRNAPNPSEQQVLSEYAVRKAGGEELKPRVEALGEDSVAFYAPIMLMEMCQSCHGVPGETLAQETQDLIQQFYAQDKATGFKAGDLRGMWSIRFEREK